MKNTNNPSAFPIVGANTVRSEGMTLRDYFAAKAMQAMIGNPNIQGPDDSSKDFDLFSKRAYRYSDAMLKNREL